MRTLTALACALLLVAAPAHASVESDLVQKGVAAYDDLDYPRAVELLEKALRESLTREERIITFRTLAFAQVALGQRDAARVSFERLLRLDPKFQLDRTISPRIRAVFEEARAAISTGQAPVEAPQGVAARLEVTAAPTPARAGLPLVVKVAPPERQVANVSVYYRARGADTFSKVMAYTPSGKSYELTVPGTFVKAPGLEYYVVAIDESGASVGEAGALAAPLAVEVIDVNKPPVYKRAWFWGVVGGVVVAGAGAGVAAALLSNRDATLMINPH